MLLILFIIYLSGIFKAIEDEILEIQTISFVDDIGLIASGKSLTQIKEILE